MNHNELKEFLETIFPGEVNDDMSLQLQVRGVKVEFSYANNAGWVSRQTGVVFFVSDQNYKTVSRRMRFRKDGSLDPTKAKSKIEELAALGTEFREIRAKIKTEDTKIKELIELVTQTTGGKLSLYQDLRDRNLAYREQIPATEARNILAALVQANHRATVTLEFRIEPETAQKMAELLEETP